MCDGIMDQEKVWDNISRKWNKFKVRVSPSAEKFVGGRTGKILDLGCGSGRNFVKVKGLKWDAVDFSEKMVGFAKTKAKKLKMDIGIVKSDSTKLPFEDDSFDSVLCFAVIHCIDTAAKRKNTLKEIYRVLKPGGEAFIATWGTGSPRLKNKAKECFVPWTLKYMKDKQMRYTYVYDLDELVKLCESVGFEIVNSWEERNVVVVVRKPK